jgi:bifunctional non-homologous end joining protein LigD
LALTEYRRKRHFNRTPEPAPKLAQRSGHSYVIQKHAASHLHYDFRLELDGVLLSWAVPKGPCLDPSVKRLAMQVEDHPVKYGTFEGIIPEGEYGGGTVMLWDRGRWEPIGDARAGYRQGKLAFRLEGEKLKGEWKLVRTRGAASDSKKQWLLMKMQDQAAKPLSKYDILQKQPNSVASGRDLEEISSAKNRVWSSTAGASRAKRNSRAAQKRFVKPAIKSVKSLGIKGAVKKRLPAKFDVQLATLTKEPPSGDEWLHEFKFDGYRMICRIDNGKVKFLSRNDQDWTNRLTSLTAAAQQLPVKTAILDGEVVAMKSDGASDFQLLQNAFREGATTELLYFAFDLRYLNGSSIEGLPLEERKKTLAELLAELPAGSPIRYSEHVVGSGKAFQKQACKLHLEGSVSKRRDQPYRPGRGYDWLKVKCDRREEFVIGGYTEPSGSRLGFGALLVGYFDNQHRLHYAGKVGTGFGGEVLTSLHAQLHAIEQKFSPFIDRKEKSGEIRTAHWVKPRLVAQIRYGSRTQAGILRHSAFEGLREDKPADEVRLEHAMKIETAEKKSKSRRPAAPEHAPVLLRRIKSKAKGESTNSEADPESDVIEGVRLSHADKLLFPGTTITKLELATYYRDVAEWMLPHIVHRPLVLVRCPDGQGKECFYQKHPGAGTPDVLRRIPIRESNKTGDYVLVDDVQGLVSLAQIGVLEIHSWGSREDRLDQPDRLIFDLDPGPEVEWKVVVDSARQIRKFLDELELETFVKTSGGKGLHLVAPIHRSQDWDEAKAFCKAVANMVVSAAPDLYMATMSKAARTKKIFVDYLRNGRGATAVVPYSPRARPDAPVSTPLTWRELSPRISSTFFTIENIRRRLSSQKKEPWEGFATLRQSLTQPLKRIASLQK